MASVRNFAIDGLNALLRNDARLDRQTFKYGLAAIRLDGAAGSYVQSGEAFELGALDWCFEAWVNVDAAQPNAVVRLAQLSTALPDQYGPGHLSLRASGGLAVIAHDFDPATPLISTSEDVIGAGWAHIALSREGSTWRLFRDGVIVGTATWAGTIAGTNPWFLGGHPYTDTTPSGWIDDARLTVGAARYTAAFTPPADQLPATGAGGPDPNVVLLMPLDEDVLDKSSAGATITEIGGSVLSQAQTKFNGSGYFDISTGYLTAESPDLALESGDFTIECWAYRTELTNSAIIYPDGSNTVGLGIVFDNNGTFTNGYIRLIVNGAATNLISTSWENRFNTWLHIALERASGTLTWYIDGTSVGSAQLADNLTETKYRIGMFIPASNWYFDGYIDDLRITKTLAVYGGPFTPPTQPHPTTSVGGGSEGFRYWRINISENNGGTIVAINEMYLLNNGIELDTSGKIYSASSVFIEVYVPGYAFDGDPGGSFYWGSSATTGWLAIDMLEPVQVDQIDIVSRAGFETDSPKNFTFEYSYDGSTWIVAQTVINEEWSGQQRRSYVIPPFGEPVGGDPLFSNVELLLTANAYTSPIGVVARRPDRLATFGPDWPVKYKVARRTENLNRITFGGKGRINGTVKVSGTPNEPVRRRVRLFEERGGIFVADTFSDATTGAYEFIGLDENLRFTVVAYDYAENYRAVIADGVVPEVIL